MDFETLLYAVYVACMAAGALLFVTWARDPKGVPVWEYIVATAIPVWSGLAYLAMGLGYGTAEVAGQTTYWARYADWVVTTPLLLVALWMTATTRVENRKAHVPLLITIVVADVVMILCGLIGDLTAAPARFVYYGVGVAALVLIFGVVFGPLRRVAEADAEVGDAYRKVSLYLALFWIGYPLTWILGPSGLGVVGQDVDTALFILLPIFSKVGFSVLDLGLLRKMAPVETPEVAVRPAL